MSFLPNVFYLIAFFAGTFVVWKLFRKENYEEEKVIDLVLFSTLVGIFAGRFFYLFSTINNQQSTISNFFTSLFLFSNGGFNFDAGIFASLLFTFYFLHHHKWPYFPALDFLSIGAFVAALVVQVGFFIATPSIRYLLFTFYFLLFAFALFFLRQYYYKKGRIFALALLATLRLPLVLTGAVSFYIIEGREYVAEFIRGFKEGMRKKISNAKIQISNQVQNPKNNC
ncbi:MAG: prolipoprotein diacylglyceryl transferase [Candidatus Cloacimonetes bacterium]|nr:prolipoprotein diacylglyceryl transferase [Candidatus Cloacimonadota bacterium]